MIFSRLKNLFSRRPPALGIAFGSGGAKGMAHLGALTAFEEEGIRFSFVTGSSIGSIVGALYAKGFSSADMIRVIENLNRKEFSKNLRPFADLSFAEEFLERYLDGDISSLPLPFAAWATDASGKGVPLAEGKIVRALAASSAIPPFFRGVDWEGKKLYDGAFSNAVPADLCKEMGARFVVGIDLSAYERTDEERGRLSRLFDSAIQRMTPVEYAADCKSRGYAAADIMLRPRLAEFRATDITQDSMDKMFERGYEEARSRMGEIRSAIKAARRKRP